MLLSIIIINYKTFEVTSECITSVYKLLKKEIPEKIEVIVVDNGSGKGEVVKFHKLRDKAGFKFLSSEKNLGFSGGCNFGAEMAEGQILFFLNSDTQVKKGVSEMINFLIKNQKVGIIGAKLEKPNGKIEKSAGKFYNLLNLFLMLFLSGEKLGLVRFAPTKVRKVDWVSGGALMIKKNLFQKLEGFDEEYFMYVEDMDLCLRSQKEGLETFYFADSRIIHKEHGSGSRKFAIYNIYRSLLVFYKKNRSSLEYNIARLLLRIKAYLALLLGGLFGKKALAETYREVLKLF